MKRILYIYIQVFLFLGTTFTMEIKPLKTENSRSQTKSTFNAFSLLDSNPLWQGVKHSTYVLFFHSTKLEKEFKNVKEESSVEKFCSYASQAYMTLGFLSADSCAHLNLNEKKDQETLLALMGDIHLQDSQKDEIKEVIVSLYKDDQKTGNIQKKSFWGSIFNKYR